MKSKLQDSKSLWNYALIPGWTQEEVEILKIALTKFGIGRWKKIKMSGCLQSKTTSQINIQTQKLLGQQSLYEYMGLHVDLERVYKDNMLKLSKSEKENRKKFIVNEGGVSKEELFKRRKDNKIKYGISKRVVRQIEIPKISSSVIGHYMTLKQIQSEMSNLSLIRKIEECQNLIECMNRKICLINELISEERVSKDKGFFEEKESLGHGSSCDLDEE